MWLARFNMVETNRRVPNSGYTLRRLTAFLAGLRREHDGTNRDPYGNIHQFKAGDDDMNPAMLEYVPFVFHTPEAEGDEELVRNQRALVHIMNMLNRCIDYKPRAPTLPVDFNRVLQRLQLDYPRQPNESTCTKQQVKQITTEWYPRIFRSHFDPFLSNVMHVQVQSYAMGLLCGYRVQSYIENVLSRYPQPVAHCREMQTDSPPVSGLSRAPRTIHCPCAIPSRTFDGYVVDTRSERS